MKSAPQLSRLSRLTACMVAAGCIAVPAIAQTTRIIGDTGIEVVTVPPDVFGTWNSLILGNTASGDGTLNLSGGTLSFAHGGGYSGYVTVGDAGSGTINQDNSAGDSIINITGPAYSGPGPGVAPDPWGGYLFIGRSDGGSGNYSFSDLGGGHQLTLNVANEIQIGGSNVSTQPGGGFSCVSGCSGSFVQNGGTVNAGGVTIGIGGGTGSYTLNSGTLNAFIDLGNSGDADNRFTQNGGTVNGSMFIGNGGNGTYTLNDGVVYSDGFILIGSFGSGTFVQNGGSLTIGSSPSDRLVVGDGSQGTFTMTGGTLVVQNNDLGTAAFVVGNNTGANGTFTQTGGAVSGGRSLTIASQGGTGTYNLGSGDDNHPATLDVGFITLGYTGTGTFNQSAGSKVTTGSIFIGADHGYYNLSGGELDVTGTGFGTGTVVGTFGVGLFNQTGGVHKASNLVLGGINGANGVYTLSAGSLVLDDTLYVGLGDDITRQPGNLAGLFQQTGGSVSASRIVIGGYTEVNPDPNNPGQYLFVNHFGVGRYELSDGTLTALSTSVGNSSQGRFVQTGGTFSAGALTLGDSGLFIDKSSGVDVAYSAGVYELSGGTLNTTGTTVSVFGQGSFIQSGNSTHAVTGNLVVGSQPGPVPGTTGLTRQGLYTFSGGVLNVSGLTTIGAGNNDFGGEPGALGSFAQSGGTATFSGDLLVGAGGNVAGGTGTYSLVDATATVSVGGDLRLGTAGLGSSANGTFTHSAGTLSVTGGLFLGSGNGVGTYTLSDTGAVSASIVYVGEGGRARFNQSGGSLATNFLNIGIYADSDSIYTLSGGTLSVAANLGIGGTGLTGNALLFQTGGSVAVLDPLYGLYVGNHGLYQLSGTGSLAVTANAFIGGGGGGGISQAGSSSVTIGGQLLLGSGSGDRGRYELGGGSLNVGGSIIIKGPAADGGAMFVSGGSLTAPMITNNDQLVYAGGSIAAAATNNASVQVQGGAALTWTGDFSNSASGTLTVASGTPLKITGVLSNAAGGTIVAGADITVGSDYVNAAFGSGNSFDRRAGITGSGSILAGGTAPATAQSLIFTSSATAPSLSGAMASGITGNGVLDFGSLRVGQSATLSYAIGNLGNTGGPALRGAIQTTVGGASITDARLSGSGVTAGNWGPLAVGSQTDALAVTFTASGSGALVGQAVGIVNNFGNTNSQLLTLSGKAYAPAVAVLNTPSVDFGIVHVGDTVAARSLSLANGAAPSALNDTLLGTLGSVSGPFSSAGAAQASVAAGAVDGSLKIGLDTTLATVASSSTTVTFASHNPDMSDAGLGSQSISLKAQVNNYAKGAFGKTGGQGSFTGTGASYVLDFGTLAAGAAALGAQLSVFNLANGPADTLGGSYDLSAIGLGSAFSLAGFSTFSGLAAGNALGGLGVTFASSTLGTYDQTIVLHATGSNASGYSGSAGDITLELKGNVVAVPEPSSYLMLAGGLLGLALARRRAGAARPG